jgi:gluconate kinase
MPTTLLDSQYRDMEPLQADEIGWEVDISAPLDAVIQAAKDKIQSGS